MFPTRQGKHFELVLIHLIEHEFTECTWCRVTEFFQTHTDTLLSAIFWRRIFLIVAYSGIQVFR